MLKYMRVALVHDYLNQWGGAERVLRVLCDMFPDAPIYTLFYDEHGTMKKFSDRKIHTSVLDWGFVQKRHRWFIPIMPLAMKTLRVGEEYDLVISDSTGFAKGIEISKGVPHVAYCHTPLRYAWEPEYITAKMNSKIAGPLLHPVLRYLRWWDYKAGQRPSVLIANSKFISGKIKRYYGRDAQVIYPPIDTDFFHYDPSVQRKDFFLAAGRLMHYKKFDLVIEVFNQLGLPLIIVGTGPEYKNLRALATSPNIKFFGHADDVALRRLYQEARAFIFPQVEDFGMVAAEAIACGAPIVAYAAGGALEIVEKGKSGIFFGEQVSRALKDAIKRVMKKSWDHRAIAESAVRFSKITFQQTLRRLIETSIVKRMVL